MQRRRWSREEIQMLQDRYMDEGPNQLALEMGRSPDSVSSFAHRCGLRTRKWLMREEPGICHADPAGPGPGTASAS